MDGTKKILDTEKSTKAYNTLLNGAVKLYQPEKGFRVGTDTVFVAAAVRASAGDRILDMGAGVGGIGMCLLERLGDVHVTGIELQSVYASLAAENIKLNKCEESFTLIEQDVMAFKEINYDVVVTNPPYMENGTYKHSPDTAKNQAIGSISLDDWLHVANRALKPGGLFVMVHRADYLQRIILSLGSKFGGIEVIPLYSREGEPAKRIVVRAIKGSRAPSMMRRGLIVHGNGEGGYSEDALKVLRGGEALRP